MVCNDLLPLTAQVLLSREVEYSQQDMAHEAPLDDAATEKVQPHCEHLLMKKR